MTSSCCGSARAGALDVVVIGTYLNSLTYDASLCVNCEMCLAVCPHDVFAPGARVVALVRPEACMECGACQRNCPTGAVEVDSGVGCAAAMIRAALTGSTEVTCGPSDGDSCCGQARSAPQDAGACCGQARAAGEEMGACCGSVAEEQDACCAQAGPTVYVYRGRCGADNEPCCAEDEGCCGGDSEPCCAEDQGCCAGDEGCTEDQGCCAGDQGCTEDQGCCAGEEGCCAGDEGCCAHDEPCCAGDQGCCA